MRMLPWLVLFLLSLAHAGDAGMGVSFMSQWSRAELKIHNANWRVEQGPNGLIYVGNGNGLLEFDGVQWRLYGTPNGTRVRDFAFHKGRLFAGTTSDLLVLEPDERRNFHWRSLIEDWPREKKQFGDIWWTVSWGPWVVFLANEHVFVWSKGQIRDLHIPDGQLDMLAAAGGRLWISTRKGALYNFHPDDLRLQPVADVPQGARFRDVLDWPDGRLLFVSRNHGLWWFDQGQFQPLEESLQKPLLKRFFYDAQLLPNGDLVLATIGQGLLFLDRNLKLFRQLTREDGLFSDTQAAVAGDDQTGLWSVGENGIQRLQWPSPLTRILPQTGTEAYGLESFLLFRGQLLVAGERLARLQQFAPLQSPRLVPIENSNEQVFAALPVNDRLLLVARAGGIWLAEVDQNWVLHWRQQIHQSLFAWYIIASKAYPGRYYGIGTKGLIQIDQDADGIWHGKRVAFANDMAHRLVEDAQGLVWVGSNIGKLYRYDPQSGKTEHWTESDGLAAGNVVPFWLNQQLVVGTTDGLKQLQNGRFVAAQGVPEFLVQPGQEVYRIIRDQRGNYWVRLGDHNGVLEQTATGWVWNEAPLLPVSASVSVNFFEDPQGIIWIGDGSGQLLRYNPSMPPIMQARPKLLLRRVSLQRTGEVIYGGAGLTGWNWPELPPEDTGLRFEYALTRFVRNDATRYRTRLKGMEDSWTSWSAETRRDVTNLDAGRYVLEIQSRDAFGQQLHERYGGLRVLPPWYATGWAWTLYVLLSLLLAYVLFRLGHRYRVQQLEKEKQRLSALVDMRTREVRQQARKLEELNEAKTRFFANVSHEFRTPLTLTIGPLETLCKEQADTFSDEVRQYLHLALNNARRMLSLVGQILDVNRLEAGRMPLRVAEADLAAFLRMTAERFEPRMQQKGIHFITRGLDEPVMLYYDVDHLDKVVSNLLSNASKFTPKSGEIQLSLQVLDDEVCVRVRDSGPGVSDEEKSLIFQRYYQSRRVSNPTEPGTGIGLSLCKELVMLHHGRIEVQDVESGGSEFVVTLLRGKAHFDPEDLVQPDQKLLHETGRSELPAEPVELGRALPESRTLVLVVDDNAELRAFLRMRMEGQYRVLEAEDGGEALEIMRQEPPDLVVTDQMMPGMNGLQLVQAIREDEELMSIPVLMLSAKSTHRDTVEGLQAGADDYLSKPFDSAELMVRLQALLAHRDRIRREMERQWSQARDMGQAEAGTATQKQDASLPRAARQLLELLATQLHDSAYGVEEMARDMAMERTTLYRNCREWFDCSPSDLLRRQRLQRAQELLKNSEYTVTEVAYACGFDSHAYFSRCFKQQFGESPSQFRKKR